MSTAERRPNPGGWPKGGQTPLDLPNNHLQYAFTWFGIALTLVGVFGGVRLAASFARAEVSSS